MNFEDCYEIFFKSIVHKPYKKNQSTKEYLNWQEFLAMRYY